MFYLLFSISMSGEHVEEQELRYELKYQGKQEIITETCPITISN
jgi:hypothetical protein